jgi:hypothetical protein
MLSACGRFQRKKEKEIQTLRTMEPVERQMQHHQEAKSFW